MLRGKLKVKLEDNKVKLSFMQRGLTDETANVPVKIYRRQEELPYGTENRYEPWEEYVDNQCYQDNSELIFEGVLPCNYSFCEYVDCDVEIGKTYFYWVAANSYGENTVLGATAVKVRDQNVWWSYKRAVEELYKMKEEFPAVEMSVERYGESTYHVDIMGITIGKKDNAIALTGAIHAGEPGPELLILATRWLLENHPGMFEKVGFAILPVINVDEREKVVEGAPFYLRMNPNGVDLNRNFDAQWSREYVYGFDNGVLGSSTYHGPYPNSENETRAATLFLEKVKPKGLFVYDSCSVVTEDYMLYSPTPDDPEFEMLQAEVATLYSKAFRENNPGCGTFTAPHITYPHQLEVFSDTGNPVGTYNNLAYNKYRIVNFSLQDAWSDEGKKHMIDATDVDLLNKWSLRHAYALLAMMKYFSK
jgi:hypothetical protein